MELNEEICEFIGAFIGDGYMGNYGKRKNQFVIGFAGDQKLDKDYFKNFMVPLLLRNFPKINSHIYYRKDENTIVLRIYSKKLFKIMESFGFLGGLKTSTMRIPEIINRSNNYFIKATLRGIFDTDGSIYFDKRSAYKTHYPRVELHLHNPNLIKEVNLLLRTFDIKVNMNQKYSRIQINGHKNVKDFIDKIGFSNERHLSKIKKIKASAEI